MLKTTEAVERCFPPLSDIDMPRSVVSLASWEMFGHGSKRPLEINRSVDGAHRRKRYWRPGVGADSRHRGQKCDCDSGPASIEALRWRRGPGNRGPDGVLWGLPSSVMKRSEAKWSARSLDSLIPSWKLFVLPRREPTACPTSGKGREMGFTVDCLGEHAGEEKGESRFREGCMWRWLNTYGGG